MACAAAAVYMTLSSVGRRGRVVVLSDGALEQKGLSRTVLEAEYGASSTFNRAPGTYVDTLEKCVSVKVVDALAGWKEGPADAPYEGRDGWPVFRSPTDGD
ncbi:hypothetical protein VP1G_10952 [Cytospora mali]|uniref:Uncharacterized protein n=1 Tax=Cytospora mali TaxID=578113 RepID=A0A194V2Y0_CYTMA|nr:hypothetical protein VP1G_10952 [Valsa mali var. pyri (nom. inval.)]